MIETPSPGAGHMRDDAIHHPPPLLVGIEILIQEMPQESPALRNPHRIHTPHRSRGLRVVFKIRKEIADRRQPGAHNRRIFRLIYDLVNLPGLKSTVQMNEVWIVHQLPVNGMRKAPLVAEDGLPCSSRRISYRQDIF